MDRDRLNKLLQPKNAVVILNELMRVDILFAVAPWYIGSDNRQFIATCFIHGTEYTGVGKNKRQAKHAAAENALNNFIISNRQPETTNNSIVNTRPQVPWDKLASYAIFKVITACGQNPHKTKIQVKQKDMFHLV
ncbi:hypothetical protein NQ317_008639 [Molorchus minor]|uniref:DRBM domain-containing protein n=1 Tax=Molorchus minor TaxID=1323400 RepID=A0ABQ9K1F8_9CUCU|nr:hypothetical protein NQ317_008639 [Molorchus minor]